MRLVTCYNDQAVFDAAYCHEQHQDAKITPHKNHTPQDKTDNGTERLVGFEIEYAGLTLKAAAEIIHDLYDGTITRETDAIYQVLDTTLGKFTLELDAIPLQKLAEAAAETEATSGEDQSLTDDLQVQLYKAVGDAGAKIAPYEIVAPPIPLRKIPDLEKLCVQLRDQDAQDTTSRLHFAFGLHINPEVVSTDTASILRHLQSFLLLYPWLKQQHNVDFARRVTRFITPFPKPYYERILRSHYQPGFTQLVTDYYTDNPTRNRALDMLPLFAHIDAALIRRLYGAEEKINPRPTFHYRLPNCELANPDWSLDMEWRRWLHVEQVANSDALFTELMTRWHSHNESWLTGEEDWAREVAQIMVTAQDIGDWPDNADD